MNDRIMEHIGPDNLVVAYRDDGPFPGQWLVTRINELGETYWAPLEYALAEGYLESQRIRYPDCYKLTDEQMTWLRNINPQETTQ